MERDCYKIVQLAIGAYDVEYAGVPIAALVQVTPGRWWVELLDEKDDMPPPFTRRRHEFAKLQEAVDWLGTPRIVRNGRSFRNA
jgi:hypothetical protein